MEDDAANDIRGSIDGPRIDRRGADFMSIEKILEAEAECAVGGTSKFPFSFIIVIWLLTN